jgi:hypothetical protein
VFQVIVAVELPIELELSELIVGVVVSITKAFKLSREFVGVKLLIELFEASLIVPETVALKSLEISPA